MNDSSRAHAATSRYCARPRHACTARTNTTAAAVLKEPANTSHRPPPVEPACPNVAHRVCAEGNRYSLVLGGGGALSPRVTPSMRNENREDQVEELFRSAIHRLSRSAPTSMLVLLTERLATGDLDELAYYLGDADRRSWETREAVTGRAASWIGARSRQSSCAHAPHAAYASDRDRRSRASSTSSDVFPMAIGANVQGGRRGAR